MLAERITSLIRTINECQFLHSKSSPYFHFLSSISNESQNNEQLLTDALKFLQNEYNKLLEDSKTLVEYINDYLMEKNNQHELLIYECEKLRSEAQSEYQENQKSMQIAEVKQKQLRFELLDRLEEINTLKEQIDLKDQQIQHLKGQINQFQKQTLQKISRERSNFKNFSKKEQNKLIEAFKLKQEEYIFKISELQAEIDECIGETNSLNKKMEQKQKYIKELEQTISDQIQSPKPLSRISNLHSNTMERSVDSRKQHKLFSPLQKQPFKLSQIFKTNRKILNQIQDLTQRSEQTQRVENQQNIFREINEKKMTKEESHIHQFLVEQPQETVNPYLAFFTLTVQCAKINSEYFEEIAELDLSSEWNYVVSHQIPMHKWSQHISKKLLELKSNL